MAKVIGFDQSKQKRVTCSGCSAIVEYVENEVKVARYSCMGDPSGHKYVPCPNCGDEARIPGTSW